ncbi:hypothetical protein AMAG_11075 [Allomyces macrogynus ATCC 38327]|uniref:Rad60/SUMO-like domain-containing protein n=1 Tax=Allomyces macrogynus (strain ATCC 38327) TaxID=578462 RepID=A0A0L0SSX5_ALLM3|nr:hypothetical protein AMAG_11075 [Allomyces macrogynus ATCC 38327]|eukprot:KNE65449.1 hypothetical protein AMAG_11075 [Allomyces macrogynus ATCC 38327]
MESISLLDSSDDEIQQPAAAADPAGPRTIKSYSLLDSDDDDGLAPLLPVEAAPKPPVEAAAPAPGSRPGTPPSTTTAAKRSFSQANTPPSKAATPSLPLAGPAPSPSPARKRPRTSPRKSSAPPVASTPTSQDPAGSDSAVSRGASDDFGLGDGDDDDFLGPIVERKPRRRPKRARPPPVATEVVDLDDIFDQSDVVKAAPQAPTGKSQVSLGPSHLFMGHELASVEAPSDDDLDANDVAPPPIAGLDALLPPEPEMPKSQVHREVTPPPDSPIRQAPVYSAKLMAMGFRPSLVRHNSSGDNTRAATPITEPATAPVEGKRVTIELTPILAIDRVHATRGAPQSYDMVDSDLFQTLATQFAAAMRVDARDVVLLYKDAKVSYFSTPRTMNFRGFVTMDAVPNAQLYEAYKQWLVEKRRRPTMETPPVPGPAAPAGPTAAILSQPSEEAPVSGTPPAEGEKIKLKIRDKEGRELKVQIGTSRPLQVLVNAFRNKFDVSDTARFVLQDPDGEPLDLESTPEDADLCDDDMLTIKITG